MHANNDPTHRGHGNSPPEQPGRHDLRRRPATAYLDIQPLSGPRSTLPNGTLAEPEATHMARSRSPDGGVDLELRGASDAVRALVGADAEFVDAAEHLGRV